MTSANDMDGEAASSTAGADLISLAADAEPLRQYFNANKGRLRFVALMSPT